MLFLFGLSNIYKLYFKVLFFHDNLDNNVLQNKCYHQIIKYT